MRAIFAIPLFLVSTTLSAQIYTWRDASGKVHYSDTPPAGMDAKQMRGGTTSSDDGSAQRRIQNEREQEFRKRQGVAEDKKAKSDKEAAEAEAKKRDCEQARAQLQALESGQRMTRFNEKGEAVFLDDAERAQETERTRKAVEQRCKP